MYNAFICRNADSYGIGNLLYFLPESSTTKYPPRAFCSLNGILSLCVRFKKKISPAVEMETYKDIPGYPNYQVSSSGLIRNKKTNRLLKHSTLHSNGKPYARVKLVNDIGIFKNLTVHRLVAKLWIPNPENKPYIDHINGNSLDNNITNLRWATAEENAQNCRMNRRNTSGFKGVYLHTISGKYMAYVRTGGHMVYLGLYETAEEASVVATEARNIAHGDFARHS